MSIKLTVHSQKIFFEALVKKKGISVRWDRECETPVARYDGSITLPYPTLKNADRWSYWAYHEVGHISDDVIWTYKAIRKKDNEVFSKILNLVVDHIADSSGWGEYLGKDFIMDKGRATGLKEMFYSIPRPEDMDALQALFYDLFLIDSEIRGKFPNSPNMGSLCFPYPEQEFAPHIRDMSLGDKLAKLTKDKDVAGLRSLVEDILNLLNMENESEGEGEGDEDSEEGEGEEGEGKKGKGEGEKSKGEKGKGEKGESQGDSEDSEDSEEGEGEEGEGDGDSEEGDSEEGEEGEEGKEDKSRCSDGRRKGSKSSKLPENLSPQLGSEPKKTRDDPDFSYREHYEPVGDSREIDLSKELIATKGYDKDIISKLYNMSNVTKQVRKHLLTLSTVRWEGGKRKGIIQPKNISKVYTHTTSATPPMYKQRNATVIKNDTAVSLVIDCSGSMGCYCNMGRSSGSDRYDRYQVASASALSLANVLSSLRIKHEILGFTEHGQLEHYIFKNFKSQVKEDILLDRLSSNRVYKGNNADGESIHWAVSRLLEQKEANKVMIVLSDGQPAGSFSGDGNCYLKSVCEEIENSSDIYLIGLGIETSKVEKFYTNNAVIRNMSELNSVVLDTLKNNIIK